MKAFILVSIATILAVSCSAYAQEKTSSRGSEHGTFVSKPLTVTGKISPDGKTFWSDIDSEWSVTNAEMLKGLEGKLVRMKCYVDTDKNSIKVLWIKKDGSESSYSARSTDSAFRR